MERAFLSARAVEANAFLRSSTRETLDPHSPLGRELRAFFDEKRRSAPRIKERIILLWYRNMAFCGIARVPKGKTRGTPEQC